MTDSSGHGVAGTVTGATRAPNAGFPINDDITAPNVIADLAATAGDKLAALTGPPTAPRFDRIQRLPLDLPAWALHESYNGSNLIPTARYVDGGLTNNTPYYYVVMAVDSSANKSTAPTAVSAMPTAATGYALQFNGGNYVSFGPASKLTVETFTIETWFKRVGAGTTVSTGGVTAEPLVTKGRDNLNVNYFLGSRPMANLWQTLMV